MFSVFLQHAQTGLLLIITLIVRSQQLDVHFMVGVPGEVKLMRPPAAVCLHLWVKPVEVSVGRWMTAGQEDSECSRAAR